MLFLASKTLSKMSVEMRTSVKNFEDKVTEHHYIQQLTQERAQSMNHQIQLTQAADHEMLESICDRVDKMDRSVVQASRFGQQMMTHVDRFSGRIYGLLQAILHSNFETYQTLLQQQRDVPPRPTNLLESNIRFEDALGEIKELPYAYFRHWEVEAKAVQSLVLRR